MPSWLVPSARLHLTVAEDNACALTSALERLPRLRSRMAPSFEDDHGSCRAALRTAPRSSTPRAHSNHLIGKEEPDQRKADEAGHTPPAAVSRRCEGESA